MRRLVPASFGAQIAIVSLASAAIVALAALLVRDVVSQTESRLLGEARQQCRAACRELRFQYQERATYAADPLEELPGEALDVSLRGLAATVLRSYEGMEGGFHVGTAGDAIGYANPANPGKSRPAAEDAALIRSAVGRALEAKEVVTATAEWNRDLLVAAAARTGAGTVAWTVKRLTGVRDPVLERRRWLLAALVLSALLGTGGIVSIWFYLHSGVNSIRQGLRRLESDFSFHLPSVPGDLGQIPEAINEMAARRMALEAELRRQDRLAALGKAVAGVAHEIRNPLNSMKLTLELLNRKLQKGTATAEEAAAAIREIDRLDLIVARLLAFGRPAFTDRRAQDMAPLLEQAASMVQEQCQKRDVRVEVNAEDGLRADVDGAQIQQVIINLLLNAIDASPRHGEIRLGAEQRDRQVAVTVTDQGAGIPEEAKPHVFDVYYTTKAEGVGLGLSVSREIVANHGGTLDFESAPGGTTFTVLLPIERTHTGEE